jgi:putative DNA primase/helicase
MTPRPVPLSVIPEGIPDDLKAERRWLIWQYECREGDGKWTKVPYVATAPQERASSVHPSTWNTFEDALAAYEDGKSDGIGFVLGDGYVGFDGDGTDASEHVHLLNTYAERSVGGRGVHAICRGTKPGDKCRTGPYELYDQGRYFTITGHHVPGTPTSIEERTAELATLYARLFPNGNPPPPPSASNLPDDNTLLAHATQAKNSEKFTALWHGDIGTYDSHSEADAALCALLAFWTNRDAAQMDRLFRRSGLMREKWDSRRGDSTYGADAIANAIAGTEKGYAPEQELRIEFIKASEVPVMKLDWLWYARLARGAITLLEGAPDSGKSTLLVDTAARVSRGQSFPGETETREPGNVVMMIAEDDLCTTVVPRLIAASADLEHIFFLGVTKDDRGNTVPFHLSDDSRRLRTKCQEVEAVFVVVDPLVSFLGSRRGRILNTNNDLEVRKALGPLKELAEQLRASVAAIRHYRKGTGTDALEAGGGSVGFSALVRVILAALPNPHVDDDRHYLLAVAKNNLVQKKKRPALAYEIVPWTGDPDIGCIAWGKTVDMSANEILAAQTEANKDNSGKAAEAKVFLEELLKDGNWVPTTEIMQAAKEQHGLSEFAVRRARTKLPIVAEKQGKPWYWRLAEPEF